MIAKLVAKIVSSASNAPWLTLLIAVAITGFSIAYIPNHFAITTDTSQLISPELDWRKREKEIDAAFPQHIDTIDIVVDGATPELAEQSAQKLLVALQAATPKPIETVRRRDGGAFFEKNGLLYLATDDVRKTTEGLIKAQPVLGTLSADPTLNGLAKTLGFVPAGIDAERVTWAEFDKPLTTLASTIEALLDGKNAAFSWAELLSGDEPNRSELRRFLQVKPVLDFSDLEPGSEASNYIRGTAERLGLTEGNGVRVRLTGSVPMADEEFSTVAEGALLNACLTVGAVLLILWFALRSLRLMFAVLASLISGLAMTAAAGLALVGTLNLISVAFAVLFIGIGIDFGIQFCVRYRQERHAHDDLKAALESAALKAGKPLALAAAATTAGFFAFLPTDYRGVSELGLIAGTGMLIAFITSITMLPALLVLINPRGEPHDVGYRSLAPVDRFMARHRKLILAATALAVLAGLPLLARVEFDFNPINLRSSKAESVATYLDLLKDPDTAPDAIEILTPSMAEAKALADKLAALPQVARTVWLASFVPDDQDQKLAIIADAASLLQPSLESSDPPPPPTDEDTKAMLTETADAFIDARKKGGGGGEQLALRMAACLSKLAHVDAERRAKVADALTSGLKLRLGQIRQALKAERVTLQGLPQDLTSDWIASDGRARIEVAPKGSSSDNANLRQFTSAVLAAAPYATGTPVLIQESANTVVRSFVQAGALALGSITLILFIALRRTSDVLMTLVPLLLAGVVTLELTVLIGLPLNFANIIALPLLLGVGVAFKIYYVLAWRDGETSLLASPLTRAVMFSAVATATAFGSLWFSSHPGTSSMGKLLGLSLLTTLAAAVLFQPILMGPPRNDAQPAQPGDQPLAT